jgi:signal transduction histidine kinase
MAWTTSAGARARPTFAETLLSGLKPAKYRYVALRRSVLRMQPAAFLALSAITLGALAPLLPTSFITGALLMSGLALAVYGAGANIAGTVSTSHSARPEPAKAASPIAFFASEIELTPRVSTQLARTPRTPRLAANHDWADLMSRVNHELRTPLNAVIGFSEMMALEMFGPLGNARYQEYVRYIRDSADDLLKSAEDTLALTGLLTTPQPADAPAACTLEHAIADAWAFVERKASGREVQLSLTLPEDVEVIAEPRVLRQILVNMLSEAVARAAPGAHVNVLAVADGELIEIVLSVGSERAGTVPRAGSLAICLARTLLEMQGTSLLEIESSAGGWRAVTVLDRAVQADFFAGRAAAQRYEREPAMAL